VKELIQTKERTIYLNYFPLQLMKLRAHVNKKYEKQGARVSVNDFIIKAMAKRNGGKNFQNKLALKITCPF